MRYSEEFIELVNDIKWQGRYIGIGNPEAKVLIVGKECALEENPNSFLYNKTFMQNQNDWLNNVRNSIGFEKIIDWKSDKEIFDLYNPLFPFYKQKFIKRILYAHGEKQGKVKSGDGGTSVTWYNYQKLFNMYLKRIGQNSQNEYIDFFKYSFVTELSEVCRLNNNLSHLSKLEVQEERAKTERSIAERYKLICDAPFFKTFDTVILACGRYADGYNLYKMFGNAQIIPTRQLSFAVADDYLERIANEL